MDLANDNPWLEVWIAGEGQPDMMEALHRSNATYLGYLDHDAVMTATQESHFVAAFYDPSRPINRAAAPNKLAEAFCVGRPVLINSEVLVAQSPELSQCTLQVQYTDIKAVAQMVQTTMRTAGGSAYLEMCRNARAVYDVQYAWDLVQRDIDYIYSRIGINKLVPSATFRPTAQ